MEQFNRTFFVDTVTYQRTRIFRISRYALLFIEVLVFYRNQGKYALHEFVVMPDHVHLLITPGRSCSLERAMQFIKGGYSYRVRKNSGRLTRFGNEALHFTASWTCATTSNIRSTFMRIQSKLDSLRHRNSGNTAQHED